MEEEAEKLYVNVHANFDDTGTNSIFVFGEPGEQVRISSNSGYSVIVTIGAEGIVSVPLPDELAMRGTGVNNIGLVLEALNDGAPFSAYLSVRRYASTDLSVIFQESSLGNEYIIASQGSATIDGGQFSVQAIEDDTDVTFSISGQPPVTVTLDAGETFKFSTTDSAGNAALGVTVAPDFNLTGTFITSSKPTAVFSGASCANIGDGACDHICEQMPPIDELSDSYILGEAFDTGTGNNLVRVVGAFDNTDVSVNGTVVATIDRGEFYEFTLSEAAVRVTTSEKALVAQYLQGRNTGGGEGDPAMTFVPGQGDWLNSYIVATPSGAEALARNLVNIVIPTDSIGSLEINGVAVDPDEFTPIAGTDLSVANINIDPGVLRAAADAEFQLLLFGYDFFDSYLTFGGADFASGLSNSAPTAAPDAVSVGEDATVTFDVLDNDSDPDAGDEFSFVSFDDTGLVGTLTDNGDGSFTYDPGEEFDELDEGETATTAFTYVISDGEDSATGTVTITIEGNDEEGPNEPPVAADDEAEADEDGTVTFNVLTNDSDPDEDDDLSITSVNTAGLLGTLTDNGDGSFTYDPDGEFDDLDEGEEATTSFSYTISDGEESDSATVTITITGVDDDGDPCPTIDRPGTQDGSSTTDDVLVGPDYHNSFYFDNGGQVGDDRITNFAADDIIVTDLALRDSNGDGIIGFGGNGVLDLSGANNGTVVVDGVTALRFLGEACEDNWVYAAAYVRPDGAIEGDVLFDDSVMGGMGDASTDIFFFDTALDLDLGDDTIANFGAKDVLVTTTRIRDANNDGLIGFGPDRLLDLPGGVGGPGDPGIPGDGGTVGITNIANTRVSSLEYDGSVSRNGVTYYVYSTVGSAVGVDALG